jgi:epoxyqueuosine reductase
MSQSITNSFAQHGLQILSSLPAPDDLHSQYPWAQSLLLIGQGGQSGQGYWPVFSQSAEYLDQAPDPIDRWSQRIGDELAEQHQGLALYPFTGPPYWPFLSWAESAGDTASSRLGMHLHRAHGLWHSYRFALLLPTSVTTEPAEHYQAPCRACPQPCLSRCPVDAFAEEGVYQVEKCRTYVQENPDSACYSQGCQARLACPEGQGSHELAQHQYHMRVFARK